MSTVWAALARTLSPVEDRPRIASDLESAAYATRSGAPYVVVHSPTARAYARLDPREFDLLRLMDGRHSVKELVVAYYQQHHVLALPRIAGLVSLLGRQGLLRSGPIDSYAALGQQLRGQSVKVAKPRLFTVPVDDVLGRAYVAWGHVFFQRRWLWLGLVLGVLGPALVIAESTRGRYALYDVGGSAWATIGLLVVLAVVALAVHELGHALAVKHAGRRVSAAGVRLYYGLPTAYVDTSDIWMAPPRQRLLTAFAGPWTGLVLGGLCAIGALVLAEGSVGAVLYSAAFVFVVDNLFNFNPLLELDGYYMLIDFLDRPLLRARALAFVRGPFWSRLVHRQPLTRDERLLASFGLSAAVYSVVALIVAVRAWQAVLVPLIVTGWSSGELPRQLGAVVIAAAIAALLVMSGRALVRRWARALLNARDWLSGRATARRHREALSALRAVAGWSDLPEARLLEVARAMRIATVAAGDEVVQQGQPADRFYVIDRGTFEVLVDGRPEGRLGRGDYFGERALLRQSPRAASVTAVTRGRVLALDQQAFDRLLATDLSARERLQTALAYHADIGDMPLLRDLSPTELDVILGRLAPIAVAAGEVIMCQGEVGDRFYIVRSGAVEVERDGEVLARLERGGAFGEIALLLDVPRTATVRAVTTAELLALDAADFRDLLAAYLGRATELERLSHLRLSTHKRLDEVV